MAKESKIQKKRVLIIEDDKLTWFAYREGLERAGLEVEVALDGEEGLAKIRQNPPDLVMLDLLLPGKSGWEVLEELRLEPAFKDLPVMIVTNSAHFQDEERGKELGTVDYLVKSNMSLKEVVERVKRYLGIKS